MRGRKQSCGRGYKGYGGRGPGAGRKGLLSGIAYLQAFDTSLFQLMSHDAAKRAHRGVIYISYAEKLGMKLVSGAAAAYKGQAHERTAVCQFNLCGYSIYGICDIVYPAF